MSGEGGGHQYQTLRLERAAGVAAVTLNRPEKLNAFTPLMGEELISAFRALAADDEVRVVIITGAARAFCAGADLEYLDRAKVNSPGIAKSLAESAFIRSFSTELYEFPKPTIAAVNGPATGIGVTMLLPMDIRIAARSAIFSMPFAKIGILPGLGSAYLLPRIVGMTAAKAMMLGSQRLTAEQALATGLVYRITEDNALLDVAHDIANAMVKCSPQLIADIKQLIKSGVEAASFATFAQKEQAAHSDFIKQKDLKEPGEQ